MPTLYHRQYEVILGTPNNPRQAVYGNAGAGSALRIAFGVQKSAKSSPNKATIKIYNMSANNRAQLTKGMLCTLSVGYRDAMQTLFLGVVSKVDSKRSGSDVETTLECGDGESAITQTHFHRSYDAGVRLAQILSDVAGAMQLVTAANPTGLTAGTMVGIPEVTYGKGVALEGDCKHILDTYCRPLGLEWSVQNGALQIVPHGNHTGEEAEVLSPSTGLIDIPSINAHIASFTALLNPRLTPGRLVKLESSVLSGYFKIRTGAYEGDSHGDKWQVAIEAVEMVNTGQILPAVGSLSFQGAEAIA